MPAEKATNGKRTNGPEDRPKAAKPALPLYPRRSLPKFGPYLRFSRPAMARELYAPRRYRLLVKVPLTVSFPSVAYRLDFAPVAGCPQWVLEAESFAGRPCWTLCRSGDFEAPVMLAAFVYQSGFEVMHPTAPAAIMERLCREGRAELLRYAAR